MNRREQNRKTIATGLGNIDADARRHYNACYDKALFESATWNNPALAAQLESTALALSGSPYFKVEVDLDKLSDKALAFLAKFR